MGVDAASAVLGKLPLVSLTSETFSELSRAVTLSSIPELLQHLFVLVQPLTLGGYAVQSPLGTSVHDFRELENMADVDVDWAPEGPVVFSCARDAVADNLYRRF